MYYIIVMISVIMFGVQFLLNDRYEKLSGSHAGATFTFSFLSSAAGFCAYWRSTGSVWNGRPLQHCVPWRRH